MKRAMCLCVYIILITTAQAGSINELSPETSENELLKLPSPDGHCVAVLLHKEKKGPMLTIEPPNTLKKWSQLKVMLDGQILYDSGDEELNAFQRDGGFALDLAWSPESAHLAYRHITSLRIIGRDGKSAIHNIAGDASVISSFSWIDNVNLLIVSKKTQYTFDTGVKPYIIYGYIDQTKDIQIIRLNLVNGTTQRHQQLISNPKLLLHSSDFLVEEISPKSDRVAFSDGENLCIYDDTLGTIIAREKIPQKLPKKHRLPDNYPGEFMKIVEEILAEPGQLEGLWWQSNDRLVIGVGLLGSKIKSFHTYDIPSKTMIDVTSLLLPIWKSNQCLELSRPKLV